MRLKSLVSIFLPACLCLGATISPVFATDLSGVKVLRHYGGDDARNQIRFEVEGYLGRWAGFRSFPGHTPGKLYEGGGLTTERHDQFCGNALDYNGSRTTDFFMEDGGAFAVSRRFVRPGGSSYAYPAPPVSIGTREIFGEIECGDCETLGWESERTTGAELNVEKLFVDRTRNAYSMQAPNFPISVWDGLPHASFHTNIHLQTTDSSLGAEGCSWEEYQEGAYPFVGKDYGWIEQTAGFRVKRNGCSGAYVLQYTVGSFVPVLNRGWCEESAGSNLYNFPCGEANIQSRIGVFVDEVEVSFDDDDWSELIQLPDYTEPTSEHFPVGNGYELITTPFQLEQYGVDIRTPEGNIDPEKWLRYAPILIPADCGCGDSEQQAPGSGEPSVGSVRLHMGLGELSDGKSAGRLALSSRELSQALLDPATLTFVGGASGNANEVIVVRDNGIIRQVRAPDTFVDIEQRAPQGIRVQFYVPSAGGAYNPQNPIVAPSGSPHTVWEIRPGSGSGVIMERTGRNPGLWEFSEAPEGGIALLHNGRRVVHETYQEDGRIVQIRSVWDPNPQFGLLSRTKKSWRLDGDRLIQEEDLKLDGAGNELEGRTGNPNSWFNFHTNGTQVYAGYMVFGPSYDETWTWYNDGVSEFSRDTYSTIADQDGDGVRERVHISERSVSPHGEWVRTHTLWFSAPVEIGGELFELEEVREPTGPSSTEWNSPGKRITRRYQFAEGLWKGRNGWRFDADGTVTRWTYEETTGGGLVTTEERGKLNATEDSVEAGVQRITVTDERGRWVSTVEKDIESDLVLSEESVIERHPSHREPTKILRNGRLEIRTYSDCCGRLESVEKNGLRRILLYDNFNRQIGEELQTSSGAFVSGYRNVLDALDRVRERWILSDGLGDRLVETIDYDLTGRVTKRTERDKSGNLTLETVYNRSLQNGRWHETVTYPAGDSSYSLVETTVRAGNGTLLEVKQNDLSVRKWVYAAHVDGRSVREIAIGPEGQETEWTRTVYNTLGQRLREEYPDNNYAEWEYEGNRLVRHRDPDGVQTLFLTEWDDSSGSWREWRTTAVDMDRNGLIDYSGLDRISRSTTVAAMREGFVVRRTINQVWKGSGDEPTTVSVSDVSADGLRTWREFDGQSSETIASYDGTGGQTIKTHHPDGTVGMETFLGGRLADRSSLNSAEEVITSTSYDYDQFGRLWTETDARGVTEYTYYGNDLVQSVRSPDPGTGIQETIFHYNARGWVEKVTHPDSQESETTYWPTGQIRRSSGARTFPVEYEYDRQGRITQMTTWKDEPGGEAKTTWSYHPERGWLDAKTYEGNEDGPSYTYWPSGRLKTRTWARTVNGNPLTTTYTYNNAGDLWTVVYSDDTPSVTHTYDRLGRLSTTLDAAGMLTLGYDGITRVEFEEYTGNGVLSGGRIDRGYDSLRRPATVWSDSGYSATYSYDVTGKLGRITQGNHEAIFGYEPGTAAHQSVVIRRDNVERIQHKRLYDALGRIEQTTTLASDGTVLTLRDYSFNDANQRSMVELEDGRAWTYQYDTLGQVTSANKRLDANPSSPALPGYAFGYEFDQIGNRELVTINGRTSSYQTNLQNRYLDREVSGFLDVAGVANPAATVTVDGQPAQRTAGDFYRQVAVDNSSGPVNVTIVVEAELENELAQEEGSVFLAGSPEVFAYDLDGNLTSDGKWTYEWDAENRLIAMESLPAVAEKRRLEFAYDSQGRRIRKEVQEWAAGSSQFVPVKSLRFFYDGWNLIEERDVLNGDTTARSHVWGLDLTGTAQGAGGVGGLLWTQTSTHTYAASADANGNIVAWIETATLGVSGRADYAAFGEPVVRTGVARSLPFGFSTKYTDFETDLLYYGYRYYNPSMGRFVNRDPIEELGGVNLYAFVGNDPVNRWDYLGLARVSVFAEAFIPWNWVKLPTRASTLVPGIGPLLAAGSVYIEGDGRGPQGRPGGSFRLHASVEVELDGAISENPELSRRVANSPSTREIRVGSTVMHSFTQEGSFTPPEQAIQVERTGPCEVLVRINMSGGVPALVAGPQPNIDFSYTILLRQEGRMIEYNTEAAHDGFPGHEYGILSGGTPGHQRHYIPSWFASEPIGTTARPNEAQAIRGAGALAGQNDYQQWSTTGSFPF